MPIQTDSPEQPTREYLPVAALDFDPQNPRFPEVVNSGPVNELIERFIRDERLLEIVTSIADQGYFDGEPLLVVGAGTGHYHVIEGNRRLAALKLLTAELPVPPGRTSIEDVCEGAAHRPEKVPCLVFPHENKIMRYLGFRHITGIKSWGSLQKARYIKKMRDRFYAGVVGKKQMTALAREIGSRSDYVAQMLTALNLYERAEGKNFYDVKGLDPQEIEFSVLSTAISYNNIAAYVGLDGRQDMAGAGANDEHLKNLLSWMFVARGDQKPVLGDSRNLKQLAAVVDSSAAIAVLVKNGNLDEAYQLSRGPAQALSLTLKAVERKLQDAWEWLPQIETPITGDEALADAIRRRAMEIRDAIKSKRNTDDE
jgi:ParB-like nuclease domain